VEIFVTLSFIEKEKSGDSFEPLIGFGWRVGVWYEMWSWSLLNSMVAIWCAIEIRFATFLFQHHNYVYSNVKMTLFGYID
jgi:hypothetical protein